MDCYRRKQEGDQHDLDRTLGDGDGDSDGELVTPKTSMASSMSISISTLRDSERSRVPLLSRPSISLSDSGPGDVTVRSGWPLPSTKTTINKCSGTFPLVVALLLLVSSMVAMTVISSTNNGTLIVRENSNYRVMFQTKLMRFLQDVGPDTNNTLDEIHDSNFNDTDFFEDMSLVPTLIEEDTSAPTSAPSSTYAPLYSPTATPKPSSPPPSSPRPTINALTSYSSKDPPGGPSPMPTINKPTSSPSISPKPSPSPTTSAPTVSLKPTDMPSVSTEPTTSISPTQTLEPSNAPVLATKNISKSDIVMTMKYLSAPFRIETTEIGIWEDVTSQHVIEYYKKVNKTYSDVWSINVVDAGTTLISQRIIITEEKEEVDDLPTSRQDLQQIVTPTIASPEAPGTRMLEITYDQWVTYHEGNITKGADLHDRNFFILPFSTDSFDYSETLNLAMNWSNWVIVQAIIVRKQEDDPLVGRISRLNTTQTLVIAASIVLGACLIVLFLLWERNHKVDANAATNDQTGLESSSNHSAIQRIQGTTAHTSSESDQARSAMSWSQEHYNNNYGNVNSNINDYTIDEEARQKSIRSAPAHLFRNVGQQKRGRLNSKDNPPLGSKGAEKSNHSRASSYSSNTDSPISYPIEVKYRSPGTGDLRPDLSRNTSVGSAFSPSNRVGDPIAIRSTSLDISAISSSNRSTSNRPYPPPVPPPSSFGINMHERQSTGDSLDISMVSEHVLLNDNISTNPLDRPGSASFRIPPSRQSFGMRVSGLTEGLDLTDSISSSIMGIGTFASEDFEIPATHLSTQSFLANQSRPERHAARQSPTPFTSPLHIPDEEDIDIAAVDRESPLPIMPTMLGLESRPIEDAILPARTGFAMQVQDIE